MRDRESTCAVCEKHARHPGRDACARCAIARAVGDGDHAEAFALAHDGGISDATVRRWIRDERDRQARAALARLLAAAA